MLIFVEDEILFPIHNGFNFLGKILNPKLLLNLLLSISLVQVRGPNRAQKPSGEGGEN